MYVLHLRNAQEVMPSGQLDPDYRTEVRTVVNNLSFESREPEYELWPQPFTSSMLICPLHKLSKRLFIQHNDDDNTNYLTELC